MPTQATVVPVHGAFADASGFAGVIRRLQEEGVPVSAPMNPLRGLASDAEAISLVSEHDNAIPPECERFMADRMNAVIESVDASHAAFIAKPDVASSLILKAVASI
jgi:hypothetical protein